MEKFIVSARKYRPSTFGTLIGQDSIAQTLKNSIKRGQLAHAYLFCGPRGVGKTTTARIFAKIINCMNPGEDMEPCGECESCRSFDEGRSYCIHELDAASNNSVDDIRALTEKVMIPPQIGRYSVYIIDEVHMLSTSAFNAFLKTLEEPPQHAIFILATTEKHKIIPTILSRCQVYDFNRISVPDIVKNLRMIALKENVQIDDNSLHVIAQKADGAMRDALTLFDQVVAFCGNTVDYQSVIKNLNILDYDYYFKLTDNSLAGNFADNLVLFDQILSKGFNALYFVGGLGNHLRNLLICKETASSKLLEVSADLEVRYREQSQRCPLRFLFRALAATEKCETDYARSNNQRLLVEFMLVRLSQLSDKPAQPQRPQQQPPAQTAAEPQTQTQPQPEKAAGFAVPRISEEETTEQPTIAEPQKPAFASALSISGLINEQEANKAQPQKPLDFMGPSTVKPITQQDVAIAWNKMATYFEQKTPALKRFIAALKEARPVLEEDSITIDFFVGNINQKDYIEQKAGAQMVAFLRKSLENESVNLAVKTKSREDIIRKMYMPQDKDRFLTETNPEFAQFKKDLGAELK